MGAVDYINKPFREPELWARVKTYLKLQDMTQRLEQQVVERTQALESAMAELQNSQIHLNSAGKDVGTWQSRIRSSPRN